MLFDPARHEPLRPDLWDPARARAAIEWIVRETRVNGSSAHGWPMHPKDLEPGEDPAQEPTSLYHGTTGVVWALRYLESVGAVEGTGDAAGDRSLELVRLKERNRAALRAQGHADGRNDAAYLMGELPIEMMAWADATDEATAGDVAARIDALVERNLDHPARQLMWGAPGSLLATSFLHERSGDPRWAERVRCIAARLAAELLWSAEFGCHYWPQELYGQRCSYLDAVHGFVATAKGLIRVRHLLDAAEAQVWERRIVETVARTATRESGQVNWRPELFGPKDRPPPMLMQFCHGAPGFVICLAGLPGAALDELLLGAGEAIWAAGPLTKGSNLCHGTAGNGYALLKLYERSGDAVWLQRARAFAMHAIAQAEADATLHRRLRYSLWTGDPGVAIYLWDCLRARSVPDPGPVLRVDRRRVRLTTLAPYCHIAEEGLRLRAAARPAMPRPSRASVPGSGTAGVRSVMVSVWVAESNANRRFEPDEATTNAMFAPPGTPPTPKFSSHDSLIVAFAS